MIQGEYEKASKIFESALSEYGVFELADGDPALQSSNHDLTSIVYNYIKCNAILNMHSYMVNPGYAKGGL